MYDAAAKVSTDFNVDALLDTSVLCDGNAAPLRSVLAEEATIVLFVRNGA